MNLLNWLDKRKHWWKVFMLIFGVSVAVVGYIGFKTYEYAPPIVDFVDHQGRTLFTGSEVTNGQIVFFKYGLMDYGSFLGDGGLRGPDFTAEALRLVARFMVEFYLERPDAALASTDPTLRQKLVEARVQLELKQNGYDAVAQRVHLGEAQAAAFDRLVEYYTQVFGPGGSLANQEAFKTSHYIREPQEIRSLSAFFFWGSWLCAAQRPGYAYSYTHNWPFDPLAGNVPHGGLILWSVIGTLVVIFALGVIFYYYGKLDRESLLEAQRSHLPPLATMEVVDRFKPTPTQRACYKFFSVAALLFAMQILAGLLAISDFIGLFHYFGLSLNEFLPVTISRAWHSQLSILWIAVCWFAATIWVLPLIVRPEPNGQLAWVNGLFWMLLIVGAGGVLGLPLGIHGVLDQWDQGQFGLWRWFGLQGWEFMQIGRAYQYLLYAAFVVWLVIVVRGVWPVLKQRQTWSLPNWMVYAIVGIILMFSAGFVASPDTNFVVADFWRWCTIHMWVEAFFELFTTILLAYFLYLMGFVSHAVAARVVYLAAVLFLGSGLIGISHNFYWNAKSIETVALGGVLSSLQVAPLVLLTVEAWRFRHLPSHTLRQMADVHRQGNGEVTSQRPTFGLAEAFLYLIGVNFWNFFGAGVFGFMINLPIINYYEHGTYLTINHAHAALFGVYGNLAIATMLFCGRWVIREQYWSPKLLRFTFWGMNLGIGLMVVMDLFPVGIHQLMIVMDHGLAYGRSQAYIQGNVFQTLTWLRGVGVAFFLAGMIPLVWFVVSRGFLLRPSQERLELEVVPPTVLVLPQPHAADHLISQTEIDMARK